MALVSIITAVHPAGSAFLEETLSSVRRLRLPAGWEYEWCVQEDGPASEIADFFAGVERVKYAANGTKLGIASTRNLALSRAEGEFVRNLDADDLVFSDAIEAVVPVFSDSSIHWAVTQADDLMPDGSRKGFPPDLPFGRVPAGAANAWAEARGGNWPIHCAGLLARTASVRALGGWGGVPTDDDIALFAALSEVTDGWFDPAITWLYRQHPNQTVRMPYQREWGDIARRIALQRVRAVRLAGLSIGAAGVDENPDVTVAPPVKDSMS
ncbi:glycosyltransferase family A protein [Catellatospora sp. KI3]|uniref:glycosyltransferase family A protein n=1 Tax=Catellatospora sp. KI3 TaxID=3041620 RepID=UPI00248265F0|nr:glycosyltransferase family A protein [Catellatospora sp. KI3]MDI1466285.1 glycosyltransferase family A protein [Catellatospora sp. KI3]